MPDTIRHLLQSIFNLDFSGISDTAAFHRHFFGKNLTIPDLEKVCHVVASSQATIGEHIIPSAIRIKGNKEGMPFAVLAQLHGNEPAGQAGILLAMALSAAGKLERDVIGLVGNPLAAGQYFAAWAKDPEARQETRDAFRCGLTADGTLLPDMNRIPVDFQSRNDGTAHTRRAQELWAVGQHICGILDIHTARGNMVCVTDHKRDSDLRYSPVRRVLTGLAEAISANASGPVTVQTLKTVLFPLPHIECQTGIEAGRHEDKNAPQVAASFTLSTLYRLGYTPVAPFYTQENGIFQRYAARPRLTYADLKQEGTLKSDDRVYMAKAAPEGGEQLLKSASGENFVTHQYDEMEAIREGQVVAVAVPSGTIFKAPFDFSGIFFSKSGLLYDKDPAVGPWPVAASHLSGTKFCYPCDVSAMPITFDD